MSGTGTESKRGLGALLRDPFLWDILVVLAVFAPTRFALFPPKAWFDLPLHLPDAAYFSAFILPRAFGSATFSVVVATTLLVGALHFLRSPRNPFSGRVSWADNEVPRLRLLLLAIGLPIVWKFSTHDVNLWLGQAHLLDRAILVALWAGMALTPLCIPLFVVFGGVMASQFYTPSCFHPTWADKALNFYALWLCWVVFVVSRFRRVQVQVYPFLFACMFAAFYFYPAVGKLLLGDSPWTWVLENRVHDLYVGSAVNGWFPGADIDRIAGLIARVDVPIQAATMFIEIGIVFALVNRWTAAAFFAAAFCMHLGIFASSGILFWEWMVPEAVLVALLLGPWAGTMSGWFRSRVRWLSIPLVIGALPWTWPYFLGWLDTPYNNVYDFELEDESGQRFQMRRGWMDPFELPTTQNRFSFADPRREIPTATYGATADLDLFRDLRAARTVLDLDAIRDEYGVVRFDPDTFAALDRFVRVWFTEMNARGGDNEVVPQWLEAPHHQWANGGVEPDPAASPIRFVRLYVRNAWWDGGRVRYLGDQVLWEWDLADPDAPPTTTLELPTPDAAAHGDEGSD